MNSRLQAMLCCPICGEDLELRAFETIFVEIQQLTVTKNGTLTCKQCRTWYPVMDFIPVMLAFTTPVHGKFAARFAQQMTGLTAYTTPKGTAMPGERSVQATFSEEWDLIQENELSFIFTADELVELNRQVWLRPLQSTRDEFKIVLNVGVGIGQETVALQKAIGNAEIVGFDLNFALLRRGHLCLEIPNFHLVIGSLFQLPFRQQSFDVVYSQGVLHHTYSTKAAFEAIAKFVRPAGFLFIWVYALDSHLLPRGFKSFILSSKLNVEKVLRPLVSRSPKSVREMVFWVLTTVFHPMIVQVTRHQTKWNRDNTSHGLRDWLSPRFAHRHSYNEVLEWFEDAGYEIAGVQSPATYRRLFGKQQYGVGVLGQRAVSDLSINPKTGERKMAELQGRSKA